MELAIFQIDAFTDKVFSGNPAAVCPLEYWLEDEQLQNIASENNLSETAFFVNRGEYYQLRWFTPQTEVDLCGHATLASAHVIMTILDRKCKKVVFGTHSGELIVKRDKDLYTMDFPAQKLTPCEIPDSLIEGLKKRPKELYESNYYMAVFESEDEVRKLRPYMTMLKELDKIGIIVTGPGENVDFVSRFFAPSLGIPEDPVTGSTHCTLIPYWAKKLNKTKLVANQVSCRGGELFCEFKDDRVMIAGTAVLYLEGKINF